jgi:hypothetical protein
MAGETD